MFHLLKNLKPTFTWPVKACIAIDGGDVEVIKFDAVFKRLPMSRINEIQDINNKDRPKTDGAMLEEVLAGLKCKDESGVYGDISDADTAELRNEVGVDKAIVQSFMMALSGEKAKN